MYQVWTYDGDEWNKAKDNIVSWDEALNFARNRALRERPENVEIAEVDDDEDVIGRTLLEEYEFEERIRK